MCKNFNCDEPARTDAQDAHARRFCSKQCEAAYDHIKADARDAKQREIAIQEERHE